MRLITRRRIVIISVTGVVLVLGGSVAVVEYARSGVAATILGEDLRPLQRANLRLTGIGLQAGQPLLWFTRNSGTRPRYGWSLSSWDLVWDRKSETIELLAQHLKNIAEPPGDPEREQYLTAAYTRAREHLRSLDRESELEPTLMTAQFLARSTPDGVIKSLRVEWLEHGFDVHGFFIEPAGEGARIDAANVIAWNADDYEWFDRLLWRDTWVPISTGEKGEYVWKPNKSRWPVVAVDEAAITSGSRVGLIYGDGRRSTTVPLYAREIRQDLRDKSGEASRPQ